MLINGLWKFDFSRLIIWVNKETLIGRFANQGFIKRNIVSIVIPSQHEQHDESALMHNKLRLYRVFHSLQE